MDRFGSIVCSKYCVKAGKRHGKNTRLEFTCLILLGSRSSFCPVVHLPALISFNKLNYVASQMFKARE